MLWRLVRTRLRPYWSFFLALPNLNAAIIDKGVAKGDTGYIVRTGGGDARHLGAADRSRACMPSTSPPARR
jgi:hypothetical protein